MRAKSQRGIKRTVLAAAFSLWACLPAAPVAAPFTRRAFGVDGKTQPPQDRPKKQNLNWNPPEVDAHIGSLSATPPCELPQVLDQGAARAKDMIDNLENFTATETIAYEFFDQMGDLQDGGRGTFDYLVVLGQGGGTAIEETRTPTKGSRAFPASSQDTALPEIALIFSARFQADYAMRCEGSGNWNGTPAWVVRFDQRKDRPAETLTFQGRTAVYHGQLKGRAWIKQGTGEVMHLETSLMEAVPMMHVKNWYLRVDYAPVQFHSKDVTIWLPKSVNAYCQFEQGRTIIDHDFANFMLFSVNTQQQIAKPKN